MINKILIRISALMNAFFWPLDLLIYIYIYKSWVQVKPDVTLSDITPLNNLLLDANFDKSTIGLHYIHILSMLAKFHGDQRLIIILSINCLIQVFVV